ncbi:MAG: hypothetical protein V1836_01790 [Candidatus Aenigmatarchaeota archaeon]
MNNRDILEYYSRDDVQKSLLTASKDREIAGVFSSGAFGQRPNILVYPTDVVNMVKSGSVAFHGSVERWDNPMVLRPGMDKDEMDEMRKGFELMIDLDIKVFEYAKIYAKIFYEELRSFGIKNIGVKYTGGKSFHMVVPFESFPENVDYKPTRTQYPLIPQVIVAYMKEKTRLKLRDAILRAEPDINEIAKKLQTSTETLIAADGLDIDRIISNDVSRAESENKTITGFVGKTITEFGLFTSRHMFRLPYSLHESSFRVSLPIKISDIDKFEKDDALPDKVKIKETFLDYNKSDAGEVTELITEALDWHNARKKEEEVKKKFIISNSGKITEEFFPPSIQQIARGVPDGRKRSVLILFNFLRNMNWGNDEIENYLVGWNEKNTPPLPSNYMRSQVRWLRNSKTMLPPNFGNENFYKSMGINCETETKMGVKNPVTYAIKGFNASVRRRVIKKTSRKPKKQKEEDEYVAD